MRHVRRSRPFSLFLPLIAAYLASIGCGSNNKSFTPHPVEGQVICGDQPVANARVTFVAVEAPKPPDIPAFPSARTDSQGNFKLHTFQANDGAPAGKYKVLIVWPKTLGREDGSGEGEEGDRLNGRYATPEASVIEVEIKPGPNKLAPFMVN